jgi:hypothetical protein
MKSRRSGFGRFSTLSQALKNLPSLPMSQTLEDLAATGKGAPVFKHGENHVECENMKTSFR